jgi:hypothetical protein
MAHTVVCQERLSSDCSFTAVDRSQRRDGPNTRALTCGEVWTFDVRPLFSPQHIDDSDRQHPEARRFRLAASGSMPITRQKPTGFRPSRHHRYCNRQQHLEARHFRLEPTTRRKTLDFRPSRRRREYLATPLQAHPHHTSLDSLPSFPTSLLHHFTLHHGSTVQSRLLNQLIATEIGPKINAR